VTAAGQEPGDLFAGQFVRLRAPLPSDTDAVRAFIQDDDLQRFAWSIPLPSPHAPAHPERDELWGPGVRFSIENQESDLAGVLIVHEAELLHRRFGFWILLYWPFRGRGYAADASGILLRHYFDALGYAKCEVRVPEFNEAALRLFGRLGFSEEGRSRSSIVAGGQRWDTLLLGMTAEEFAALRRPLGL
jgi:RimJ/RimL family protein N-acetyltransferase